MAGRPRERKTWLVESKPKLVLSASVPSTSQTTTRTDAREIGGAVDVVGEDEGVVVVARRIARLVEMSIVGRATACIVPTCEGRRGRSSSVYIKRFLNGTYCTNA